MPRSDTVYVCQSCGSVHAKWAGRCDGCGSWNTLQEESDQRAPMGTAAKAVSKARRSKLELFDLGSETDDPPRFETGLAELDRDRRFWWAAIRGSANRRFCCRPWRVWR